MILFGVFGVVPYKKTTHEQYIGTRIIIIIAEAFAVSHNYRIEYLNYISILRFCHNIIFYNILPK